MSMAFGVELRTPFLDARARRHAPANPGRASAWPPASNCCSHAVPDLPDGIACAAEALLSVPVRRLVAIENGSRIFASIDRTCPVPTGTWYRKWCVFVLEHWLETVNNGVRAWT